MDYKVELERHVSRHKTVFAATNAASAAVDGTTLPPSGVRLESLVSLKHGAFA